MNSYSWGQLSGRAFPRVYEMLGPILRPTEVKLQKVLSRVFDKLQFLVGASFAAWILCFLAKRWGGNKRERREAPAPRHYEREAADSSRDQCTGEVERQVPPVVTSLRDHLLSHKHSCKRATGWAWASI